MELRQLRYFVTVAEELHFGRAAARLGMSQPPLSQQIRALEQELGLSLLERTSRRVKLTEAGRLFLAEARKTLDQAERAAAIAQRARSGEIGELSIGFTASVPFVPQVASALFRFRTAYPAVHLQLNELPRDTQIEALVERQLDLGFIRGVLAPRLPEGLEASLFLEEPLLVAMHEGHRLATMPGPIRIADLEPENFVLYRPELGAGFIEPFMQLCGNAGFRPRVVQEASGSATLLGLVAAGFGITVISRSFGALHLDNVVHRPFADPDAISRLWLVRHRTPSPTCELFIGQLTG